MADLLLEARWRLLRTQPGAAADPDDLERLRPEHFVSLPAGVPGTAASAWRDEFGEAAALALVPDDWDWWFLADFTLEPAGLDAAPWALRSAGIATYATLWLNDRELGTGNGAFDALDFPASPQPGANRLAIRCRPLRSTPTPRKPRARWRSSLVADSSLRWHRTPLLGHIPWHGTVPAIGPWAEISLAQLPPVEVRTLRTEFDGGIGRVIVGLSSNTPIDVIAELAGPDGTLLHQAPTSVDGETSLTLEIANPALWFPHSHGSPVQHRFRVRSGAFQRDFDLGFRGVAVDRRADGFELSVNGQAVFARGVVWAPLDALRLGSSNDAYRQALCQLAEAGVNLIRISGTGSFEQPAFYQECDRLGIMVWQDCMLATLDPPDDAQWLSHFSSETRSWLDRLARHPSAVVVSGGNETEQQPAFWGRDAQQRSMTVLTEIVPELVGECLPAAVHVSSSPSGSGSPVKIRSGISHYFGVGAYRLPLSDARTSGVRFAAESLAFAVPPEPSSIVRHFGGLATGQPQSVAAWATGTARDPGATWTFGDVAEHYATEFFGPLAKELTDDLTHEPVDAGLSDEPSGATSRAKELDRHRAAIQHAVAQTMVEWRRPESSCSGALVLSARDLAAGSGFGIVDVDGVPKSAWYGFKSSCAPLAVAFLGEGLNGIDLHLFNDRPEPFEGTLHLRVHGVSGAVQAQADLAVELSGHGARRWELDDVLGGFMDLDHVWQFGARQYDTIEATVRSADGAALARTVRLLGGIDRPSRKTGLAAWFGEDDDGAFVQLRTDHLATFVALDLPGWTPEDNYFHLPAASSRRLRCQPARSLAPAHEKMPAAPWGTFRALNDPMAPQPLRPLSQDEINQGGWHHGRTG